MEFVGLLSSGKGTWGQVVGLIKRGEWDKIIIVGNSFAKKAIVSWNLDKNIEFVEVDTEGSIQKCIEELKKKLKEKIKGVEVALSIASGTGKEHMALISALLSIPVGVKFAVLTKDGPILI